MTREVHEVMVPRGLSVYATKAQSRSRRGLVYTPQEVGTSSLWRIHLVLWLLGAAQTWTVPSARLLFVRQPATAELMPAGRVLTVADDTPVPPLSPVKGPDGFSELDCVRELARKGIPPLTLAEFVVAAWDQVVSEPLVWGWYMQALCDHLQAQLERGRFGMPACRRAIYNVPPGTSKSLILNVFAPAWHWTWDPSWSVICSSANPRNVLRDAGKCRDLIRSRWYRDTFAIKWKLKDDKDALSNFGNSKGGVRSGLGAGAATITGLHASALFFDDLLDANEAFSKPSRDGIAQWVEQAALTRVNDRVHDTVSLIMQRLHVDDPAGHLLRKGGWEHLRIPMEYEMGTRAECDCESCKAGYERARTHDAEMLQNVGREENGPTECNPPFPARNADKQGHENGPQLITYLGWSDPRRTEGELLSPDRFPREVLDEALKDLGSAGYAGQMQQRPVPLGGGFFKSDWWRFYTRDGRTFPRPYGATQVPPKLLPMNAKFESLIQSWDCAFRALDTSDYVCGLVMGKIGADRYILDVFWEHADFTQTCEAVLKLRKSWPMARTILIEARANGDAVINVLGRKISGVIPVEPLGGKESRAAAAAPCVESGNVYFPEGAPWLERAFAECSAFPLGAHDDFIDALSQGLLRLEGSDATYRAAVLLGRR